MSEPLVSVIIPMYNHAPFVRECLDSLLTEGWPNLEVLLLDDGSSDGSFEVAQQWRREHPGAFSRFELGRQANQGVTRTLNRLVGMAAGEFIALVASDDCLLSGGIATRVKALAKHPEWLVVFGDSMVIDENGKRLYDSGLTQIYALSARPRALQDPRLIHLELILRWTVPGPGLLVRREAYDPHKGIGLYDESLAVEDRDFYLRLLGKNALGFINCKVAAYRMHTSNSIKASGQQRNRHFEAYARSAQKAHQSAKGLERLALWADLWRYRAMLSNSSFYSLQGLMRIGLRLLTQTLRLYQDFRAFWLQRDLGF